MWREHAGCDKGTAATISMHATSPFPAKCRKMQILAGWAKAFAKPAKRTDDVSNASNFAIGMNFIFQICDTPASDIFSK